MNVLLIEDNQETRDFILNRLRRNGHTIEACADAETGLHAAGQRAFDVIVIDRMLPGLDGLTAVQRLRQSGVGTSILMLSALAEVSDRTEGLFAGADDYLGKPFAVEELLARLHALGRRGDGRVASAATLTVGDLVIDRHGRHVARGGKRINLVAKEYEVLELLALRREQVVTRRMLLEEVWQLHFDPGTNIVESQVSRLRAKLDEAGSGRLIHTARGQGYVLRAA